MSKTSKIISWFVGFWLMTILFFTILANQQFLRLGPGFIWLETAAHLLGIEQMSRFFGSSILSQYLFWSSVIIGAILLLMLLVISFYPRTKAEIDLKENHGQLRLSQSAVEGLVKSVVEELDYMKRPSVSAKLYRNTIKVSVKGPIVPRVAVADKTKQMEDRVVYTLREFVGLNYPLKIKTTITNTNKRPRSSEENSRVI